MNEIGIYLHIPFCVQKCNYCDFLSGNKYLDQIEEYIDGLLQEMEQHQELLKKYIVRSIFIGGGTPSILSPDQIERIMTGLQHVINGQIMEDVEITIESNPGTLTKEKLSKYVALGINRISMGLQSTFDEELKNLGRIHTYEQFLDGYWMARDAGFANINVDLMSGLPNQTLEKWEVTLHRMLDLNPEHISAYSLIIEEGTKFYEKYGNEKGQQKLPDEELDRLLYQKTKEILAKAGYKRYEISNYAKPGYESRHNTSYWIGIDYLGIGLGASSLIQKKRYRNEENMECYLKMLKQKQRVAYLEETLDQKSQIEEFMILGLRMMAGVSKTEFQKRFGQTMDEKYGAVLEKLNALSLIQEQGEYIRLTEQGIDVSNEIFIMFMDRS